MNSAIYRKVTGGGGASITAATHPLPLTQSQRAGIAIGSAVFAVIIISVAFAFIPASFAVFVVKERGVNGEFRGGAKTEGAGCCCYVESLTHALVWLACAPQNSQASAADFWRLHLCVLAVDVCVGRVCLHGALWPLPSHRLPLQDPEPHFVRRDGGLAL